MLANLEKSAGAKIALNSDVPKHFEPMIRKTCKGFVSLAIHRLYSVHHAT